jgi:hypothetical protein
MKRNWLLYTLAAFLLTGMSACKKKGCTDEEATNYNEEAQKDDESCTYAPIIVLNGDQEVNIPLGGNYEDEGATATNQDGSSLTVVIDESSDEVNTSIAGTYIVTYKATNENGVATVSRTVNVVITTDTWEGSWSLSSQCSGVQFPLSDNPTISETSNGNLEITDMFDYLGLVFGSATAVVEGDSITVPEQTYSNNGLTIIFSGSGTMNETGTVATIDYAYDNTTPLVGGDPGTCTATYEKQ